MAKNTQLVILQPNPNRRPAPLKYYDPELQDAGNAEPYDEARFQRAGAKAKRLCSAYLKQLAQLRPRLSKRTYSLFADERQLLFDSNVLEFMFGDSFKRYRTRGFRFTTAVSAKFLDFDMKTIHVLKYRGVDSLNINVPSERWYDWGGASKNIDRLLANELTAVNPTMMEHRFLFSSGTTISVKFSRVTWGTKRAPR
jgi:hypothetical protein